MGSDCVGWSTRPEPPSAELGRGVVPQPETGGCHLTRDHQTTERPAEIKPCTRSSLGPCSMRQALLWRVRHTLGAPMPDSFCPVLQGDAHFPACVGRFCGCEGRTPRNVKGSTLRLEVCSPHPG